MMRLLLVEDDIKIGELLKAYFEKLGHELIHAELPSKGMDLLSNQQFDLIILDIMMPEMDGFNFCKEIRKSNDIPIIMLTARGDTTDRIVGLELGADDYLSKPFDPRELLARIEAVLRRSSNRENKETRVWSDNHLVLDLNKREGHFEGVDLELTTMEFELLKLFIKNTNLALSRDEIMNQLQGIDADVFSRSIDIAVSRLRQKLKDDSKNPSYIKTIWGTGYMFLGRLNEKN